MMSRICQIWTSSLAMFKLQFRQLWCPQNLPNLATNINFGNWQCLPILATDDIRQFWQLTIFANFSNWRYLPILATDDICGHIKLSADMYASCLLMCCKPSLACSFTSEFIVLSLMSSLYGCASGSHLQQIVCGRRKLAPGPSNIGVACKHCHK